MAEDLNRRGAEPHEPLPALVQQAYTLLGADWRETARQWKEAGHQSPPVMLTVCNRTETAARRALLHQGLRALARCIQQTRLSGGFKGAGQRPR